jgi:hypothetical protein
MIYPFNSGVEITFIMLLINVLVLIFFWLSIFRTVMFGNYRLLIITNREWEKYNTLPTFGRMVLMVWVWNWDKWLAKLV